MKLLIVSHTPHYRKDGIWVGWGPTVREIDYLAQLFSEVRHIACLYPDEPPASALPYSSPSVSFVPVPPAGGEKLTDKLSILRLMPLYLRTIWHELADADFVHVRCPANISLLAILLLALVRHPRSRWVKYAGNWQPNAPSAWSYTFQRWWLNKGLHRGVVTVNGQWPNQPKHVYSFLNPSLTKTQVRQASIAGNQKKLQSSFYLLFVGAVNEAKGVGRVLQVAQKLQQWNVPFELHLLGDGPERPAFEAQAKELGIASCTTFHGWLPKPALADFYARAHFMVFPSASSEGWPKVLSEAMTYGVVPIAGAVSSIPQILGETGAGVALRPDDVEAFVEALLHYIKNPEQWQKASRAGMAAASRFTYESYLFAVRKMCQDAWRIELSMPQGEADG